MAFSQSIKKSQTPLTCQLCKICKIIWKCFDCKLLMCDNCKSGVHQQIAKDHRIIDIRNLKSDKTISFEDIKCQEHGEQPCCLFCKRCNKLICVKCMAKIHNGHELIEEEEYNESQLIDQIETPSELRSKLEKEHERYKYKLQAYEDRQAELVKKLQAKESDKWDHESVLIKLEEEQQRSASLAHVNAMLRQQLDGATAANQSLTNDIHKLTNDWQRAREELEGKEAEWREEEQAFNEYFSNEHARLLSLWREVDALRRSCGELKTETERDISHFRSDVVKASRSIHSACLNLVANQKSSDSQLSVMLDHEKQERMSLENQLRVKSREIKELQSRYDTDSAEKSNQSDALTKFEVRKSDLESDVSKAKTEQASLRDEFDKTQQQNKENDYTKPGI